MLSQAQPCWDVSRQGKARRRAQSGPGLKSWAGSCTYDINTSVSRNSDDGVESTEVDTNDAHLRSDMTVKCTSKRVEESRFRERMLSEIAGIRRSSREWKNCKLEVGVVVWWPGRGKKLALVFGCCPSLFAKCSVFIAFLVGVGGRVFWCNFFLLGLGWTEACDSRRTHSSPPLAAPRVPQGRVVSISSPPTPSHPFPPLPTPSHPFLHHPELSSLATPATQRCEPNANRVFPGFQFKPTAIISSPRHCGPG